MVGFVLKHIVPLFSDYTFHNPCHGRWAQLRAGRCARWSPHVMVVTCQGTRGWAPHVMVVTGWGTRGWAPHVTRASHHHHDRRAAAAWPPPPAGIWVLVCGAAVCFSSGLPAAEYDPHQQLQVQCHRWAELHYSQCSDCYKIASQPHHLVQPK